MRYRFAAGFAAVLLLAATSQSAGAQAPPKNFIVHAAPTPIAAIGFQDDQGHAKTLADFKGKVVVLNIWATWCTSCRTEMPALDRLEADLGGPKFAVVALSIDRGGISSIEKFYAATGISHLPKYVDSSGQVLRGLGALGLPTTLLLDREGNEVGRVVGAVEWDAADTIAYLKSVIAER
ncbi:MAG TPA: TlpA disulfide reductase family protein [Pseudolabrys sp.]|nr:TlpA disulfide reductase family protein [Pseudolabrys sp.]